MVHSLNRKPVRRSTRQSHHTPYHHHHQYSERSKVRDTKVQSLPTFTDTPGHLPWTSILGRSLHRHPTNTGWRQGLFTNPQGAPPDPTLCGFLDLWHDTEPPLVTLTWSVRTRVRGSYYLRMWSELPHPVKSPGTTLRTHSSLVTTWFQNRTPPTILGLSMLKSVILTLNVKEYRVRVTSREGMGSTVSGRLRSQSRLPNMVQSLSQSPISSKRGRFLVLKYRWEEGESRVSFTHEPRSWSSTQGPMWTKSLDPHSRVWKSSRRVQRDCRS